MVLRQDMLVRGPAGGPTNDPMDLPMALIHLADDDPMVREIVDATLTAHGHVVGTADNGADAVRFFNAKRPDLVILDCAMPGMEGIEALRLIRLSSGASHVPILMLTARRSSMDETIAIRAGADDYLRKPFNTDQLLVRVELLLQRAANSRIRTAAC